MDPRAAALVHEVHLRLQRRLAWLEVTDDDDPVDEMTTYQHHVIERSDAWRDVFAPLGLAEAELDALGVTVALGIEPALGPAVADASGSDEPIVTEQVVRRLYGLDAARIVTPASGLVAWRLVRSVPVRGGGDGLVADPRVVDWVVGEPELDAELVGRLATPPDFPVPEGWDLADVQGQIARAHARQQPVRVLVESADDQVTVAFGRSLADHLGLGVVVVDAERCEAAQWPDVFLLAQRFAEVVGSVLVWTGAPPPPVIGAPVARLQIQSVAPGVDPGGHRGADLYVSPAVPSIEDRAAVWGILAPDLDDPAEAALASADLGLGDIAAIARTAPGSSADVMRLVRARGRARSQTIGQLVEPSVSMRDLIVDQRVQEALGSLIAEAGARAMVIDGEERRRVFGAISAPTALLSGASGLGKTMAAEVVAGSLGLSLLRVDLSAISSKYIGETAKNLSEAFDQVHSANAALLFDEADSLFAKRTEVRDATDRYANADTNHLLQLMERHGGVVMLTTNRRNLIDDAFVRRLRHTIEFERPDAVVRTKLWIRFLGVMGQELSVDAAEDNDEQAALRAAIARLGDELELTPAQIKSAVLTAAYTAAGAERSIVVEDLTAAAAVERTRDGRPVVVERQPQERKPIRA